MKRLPPLFPVLLALLLVSCSGEAADSTPASGQGAASDSAAAFQGRIFERNVVFLNPRTDSLLIVPWIVSARTLPGGVRREARGLLGRADTWEPFFTDQWETAPTREPWRVLPRGQMRLVVGENEVLEQIVFDQGPRQLAVELGGARAEWSGQRGETFRVLDGTLVLSATRIPGLVLDMARGRTAREAPGDWAVLTAGDSLQLVLHAPVAQAPGTSGAFRGWALLGSDDLQWPRVTIEWTETRNFERARRSVPSRWSVRSSGGEMAADLSVRAAHLEAGTGDGPQLPVDALFEVQGTVRLDSLTYPVQGLLRHVQP